jgi:hypothetical protein
MIKALGHNEFISYFFRTITKYLSDRNNLKEERFILAHGFRWVTWPSAHGKKIRWQDQVAKERCLSNGRGSRERKGQGQDIFKFQLPVTYFLQLGPNLLKFPEPPQIVPPAGDLVVIL